MKFRKLLSPIIAAYLALIPIKNSNGNMGRYADLIPEGYFENKSELTYRIEGNHKGNPYGYSGNLLYGDKNGAAWFVYDTLNQEIIGDEKDERERYSKLALNFEIERFDDLNPGYPITLRKLSKYYQVELLEHEVTFKIPNFVLEEGSKLEGILVGAVASGGANLSTAAQEKIVEAIISKESAEIMQGFKEKIYSSSEEMDSIEIASKLKQYLEETLEYKIINAGKKLEYAAELFEKNQGINWTPKKAQDCFNAWSEGHITGLAYVKLMNDIENNVDWAYISRKISANLSKGLTGKSLSEIASEFDIAAEFLNEPDMVAAFNNLDKYLNEEMKKFSPIIGRFDVEDLGSPASRFLDSKWPEIPAQNTEAEQTIYDFLDAVKRRDINLLIKDMRFKDTDSLVHGPVFYIGSDMQENEEIMDFFQKIYSCNKTKLSYLRPDRSYEIFYLKPEAEICDDGLNGDLEYRGEIFYLKKENNSWNIKEIVYLSKEGLRARAKQRMSGWVTLFISEYAENGMQTFPRHVLQEPKIIPSFNENPLGVECDIPFYEEAPSKNRCFYSYAIKNGKISPYDDYIMEAAGNLDNDPDLEIMQIGVGSKEIRHLRKD